jgi:hypothetical protein
MECGTFEQDEEEQKKGVDAESNTTHSGEFTIVIFVSDFLMFKTDQSKIA